MDHPAGKEVKESQKGKASHPSHKFRVPPALRLSLSALPSNLPENLLQANLVKPRTVQENRPSGASMLWRRLAG